MSRAKKIFGEFLVSYIKNNLQNMKEYFDDDTYIQFSTVGTCTGFQSISEKLTWSKEFATTFCTMTNVMEFCSGDDFTICATVHHFLSNEKRNELFPLLFGGKYMLRYDAVREKIIGIQFDLEYEFGNVWLVKDYFQLYAPKAVRLIDNRLLLESQILPENPNDEEKIRNLIYRFFWALDTMDENLAGSCVAKTITIERDGVKNDKIRMTDSKNLLAFMEEDKDYYDMNQYSIRINHIDVEGEIAHIEAQHLSPHKTGNKHLNVSTKYNQFFDEDMSVECIKEEGEWKIGKVGVKRAADLVYIGYELLEL